MKSVNNAATVILLSGVLQIIYGMILPDTVKKVYYVPFVLTIWHEIKESTLHGVLKKDVGKEGE